MNKKAIIVGSAGQDGIYLSRLLSTKKYFLTNIAKNTVLKKNTKKPFNILDSSMVNDLIKSIKPQEVYYLAAYHHSSTEKITAKKNIFKKSYDIHCVGLINFINAIIKNSPNTRIFYAASSLIFGNPKNYPQDEKTKIAPICIYGLTKAIGMEICDFYSQKKNVFCSAGILYNHESPLRSNKFVSQKIIQAAYAAKKNNKIKLKLGNLDARVDWSFAGDFVLAFNKILQLKDPSNFIISSGKLRSIREFVEIAFNYQELNYKKFVTEDHKILSRPIRKIPLLGDNRKLRLLTNWSPSVTLEGLIKLMTESNNKF